jgi:hypothetical protein
MKEHCKVLYTKHKNKFLIQKENVYKVNMPFFYVKILKKKEGKHFNI